MTRRRPVLFDPDVPRSARAALDTQDGGAVLVVDIARGRIAAANAAGLALIGLAATDAGAGHLDRAMHLDSATRLDAATPALATLREAEAAGASEIRSPLVFWPSGGALRLEAHIAIVRADGKAFGVVTADPDAAAEALQVTARAPPADDGATLQEIARRIRAGPMAEAAPPPPAQASNDVGRAAEPEGAPIASGEAPAAPIAVLAHEVRTPLNAILASADIMKDERFGPLGDPRYVRYAADIHAGAQHILHLVERLLDPTTAPAAPEAVSPDMNFVALDIGSELTALVSQLAPLAEPAELALALDVPPHLPRVIADATSLRQMVLNLATNALKFTPRGGRVTIGAAHASDGTLAIVVTDTGPGLSADDLARLKDAPLPVSPRAGGLGLPIVRALAEANGAELVLDSAPDQGTTARIVFGRARVVPV